MRIAAIVIGGVIALMGSVFWLQGLSVLGPVNSFMYKNPEWITNGMAILLFGVVVIIGGLIIGRPKMSL